MDCLGYKAIDRFVRFSCVILAVFLPLVLSNDCLHSIFVVEQSGFVAGKVIDAHPNVNLDECASECASRKTCGGANFVIDLHSRPTCLLVDKKRKARNSETPNEENVMYDVQRICSKFKVDKKRCVNQSPWTFERFAQYALVNSSFAAEILPAVEVDECLYKCSLRSDCAAAIFSRRDSTCQLSRVSLHNVNSIRRYFRYDNDSDVYEANCVNRTYSTDHCSFLRVNHAGFTDLYDMRQPAASREACETKCVDTLLQNGGTLTSALASPCRSYTFDARARLCYLSHTSHRAFGRNALDHADESLSYGDLDNCVQFNLNCMARGLMIRGRSLKLFHGTIRAKQNGELTCPRSIDESYEFVAEFSFHECRLHREVHPTPTYSSLLMIKEGTTDLITIHDKMIQVSCRLQQQRPGQKAPQFDVGATLARLHNESRTAQAAGVLSAPSINVIPTSPLLSAGGQQLADALMRQSARVVRPRFTLEVLDRIGRPATVVDINQRGYLQITMNDEEGADRKPGAPDRFFVVSGLAAESISENKSVSLIDSNGCVSNPKLVKSLKRIGRNKLQIEVEFGGFHDQSRVTYQTLVKRCATTSSCFAECNRRYFEQDSRFVEYYPNDNNSRSATVSKTTRTRRSADEDFKKSDERLQRIHLSEELYELRVKAQHVLKNDKSGDCEVGGSAYCSISVPFILAALMTSITVLVILKAIRRRRLMYTAVNVQPVAQNSPTDLSY